ncbi:hypothetical protein C817_00124 [Dorea sp. 5-2]|nr:hypothetical protein C817_00124 [Dorea sp. 5-2]
MFWIYVIQTIIWYYLLVKVSKDILNPFAISATLWFLGAALSQLRLSELIARWGIQTHFVVHIFAYVVIVCGFLFSKRNNIRGNKSTCLFLKQYKYVSRFFFGIALTCTVLEWMVNGFCIPILLDSGSDLKSELVAISGIHYGTVCFTYFSLVALFELLFDENSNKRDRIYNRIVILLTLFHALFIQMSRGDLLIIIFGALLLIHGKYRIRFKYLVLLVGCVLLSLLALMLVRVQNTDSLVYTAVETNPYVSAIYMYIATCFDNLNSLIEQGSPYTLIYITILKPIFEVFNFTVPIPYLEYSVEFFNAKTMIYGFYHDLGTIGVVMYSFCIYSLVGTIYKKTKYDERYLLLLAALQKSIYVTFFGNYFTGTVCTTFPFIVVWMLCMCMDKKKISVDVNEKKNKLYTVVIVYEGIVREYDNALLLKSEFERRGYNVRLVAKYYPIFHKIKNAIIILPNCYNTEDYESYSYYLNSNGNIFISLQYEQVLSKRIEKIGIHNPKGKARNIYLFCWGENCFQRLLDSGINSKYLYISGAIQLDFLRQDFEDYYLSREDIANRYNLNGEKKWLLYISSFSYVDNVLINKYTAHEFNDNEFVKNFSDVSIRSQRKTLEWFEKLILKNKDIIIIYRKHPMESKSILLKQMTKKYPKQFYDLSELSVKQWIKVSDIITTWFSTSIAEIYVANKPMFLVRPYLIEKEYDVPFYYDAKCIDSFEKLNLIVGSINESEILPIPKSSIESYYSINDKPAYMRIVDKVEDIFMSDEQFAQKEKYFVFKRWKFLFGQNRILKYFIKRVYQFLYYYIHFEIKNEKFRKEFAVSDWEYNIRNEKDSFNENKYMKLKEIVNKKNEYKIF